MMQEVIWCTSENDDDDDDDDDLVFYIPFNITKGNEMMEGW